MDSSLWYIPIGIFLLGMASSLFAFYLVREALREVDSRSFRHLTVRIREGLESRLQDAEVTLEGTRGLFRASKSVERGEWREYLEAIDKSGHSGTLGFGYIHRVNRADTAKFIAEYPWRQIAATPPKHRWKTVP